MASLNERKQGKKADIGSAVKGSLALLCNASSHFIVEQPKS